MFVFLSMQSCSERNLYIRAKRKYLTKADAVIDISARDMSFVLHEMVGSTCAKTDRVVLRAPRGITWTKKGT